MNCAEPLYCDPEKFQAIYQNLMLFGNKNHEQIILNTNDLRSFQYFPVTAKKQWRDFKDPEPISRGILDFFDKNLESLANASDPHALLSKLKPIFKGDKELKVRCDKIRLELFKINAIKATEQQITAILQEAEKKVQESERTIQKGLEDYQKRIHGLEIRLEILKNDLIKLEDTLLVCKDSRVSSHLKILQKICFFQRYKDNFDQGMNKNTMHPEEKDKFKCKFDFTDFYSKTISSLLDWLHQPESLNEICSFSALYELYRLADYLNDTNFRSACFTQLKKQLTKENRAEVLSLVNFSIDDPLIKECCDFACENFNSMICCEKFLEIQPEYLINSVKNAKKENQYTIFEWMVNWADAQAKKNKSTVQEILYSQIGGTNLIKQIDFKLFSKEQFLTKVCPPKVLIPEDAAQWLEFHLKRDVEPISTTFNFRKINDSRAEILWKIPLEEFCTFLWDNMKIEKWSPFCSFGDCRWWVYFQKHKERPNKIELGIITEKPKFKFEYFHQINNLHHYSGLYESEAAGRGIIHTKEELMDNVDLTQGCLSVKFIIILKKLQYKSN